MKLFTSLPPRDTKEFRTSWTNAGFRVVTVNSCNEDIVDVGDGPERAMVRRDASALVGKPLVFFDDLLKVAADASAGDIFGIINADIILDVGSDFVDFIREQARGGLVFGSRTEISTQDGRDGEMYIEGFDFFFIDPAIVPLYPPTEFCLGTPWWDYWAPLVPITLGIPVKWLVTPVAYHVTHPIIWNNDLHEVFGRNLLRQLQSPPLADGINEQLRLAVTSAASDPDLYPVSLTVCRFIREQAEHIFYPGTPHLKESAIIGKSRYRQLLRRCRELEGERDVLQANLDECMAARQEAENLCREQERRLSEPGGDSGGSSFRRIAGKLFQRMEKNEK